MFDFTESVVVDAPPARVWRFLSDIDRWWLASNPEHQSLEHLDSLAPTQVGAKLRIREKIGGLPGVAMGTITEVIPGTTVTWRARAWYRWRGIPVRVGEGVTWRVDAEGAASRISARVWANFPRGLIGRLAEFVFVRIQDGVEKDREHTRTELRYLKERINHSDGLTEDNE